ncbi:MAG: hypothetical protein JXR48_16785 [Candidatus Delongbacteria bacterium]|nr:hypothetical protein [Candidatus Delongbacteria bacterium]MBN2836614.1 hypothetical protein [Candidatus Delongbacteria bacterium]
MKLELFKIPRALLPINSSIRAMSSKLQMNSAIIGCFLSKQTVKIINPVYTSGIVSLLSILNRNGSKAMISDNFLKLDTKDFHLDLDFVKKFPLSFFKNLIPILLSKETNFDLKMNCQIINNAELVILKNLGVDQATYKDSAYNLRGIITGGFVEHNRNISDAFFSSLLMVLPTGISNSTIQFENEIPSYVHEILEIMKRFRIRFDLTDHIIKIYGNQKYDSQEIIIDGDWIESSYLMAIGALYGSIRIDNLMKYNLDSNNSILRIYKDFGAHVEVRNKSLIVKQKDFKAFNHSLSEFSSLFPMLFLLASIANEKSIFRDLDLILSKNKKRFEQTLKLLDQISIRYKIRENEIEILPGFKLKDKIYCNDDSRVVMSVSIFSLFHEKEVQIFHNSSITKNYPDFINDIEKILYI